MTESESADQRMDLKMDHPEKARCLNMSTVSRDDTPVFNYEPGFPLHAYRCPSFLRTSPNQGYMQELDKP